MIGRETIGKRLLIPIIDEYIEKIDIKSKKIYVQKENIGKIIELELIDIRDFSKNKHKKVDDTPYGGGARNGYKARCYI